MISKTMVLKSETNNKYRYTEDGIQTVFGDIYIWKQAFDGKPPKSIMVTLRSIED